MATTREQERSRCLDRLQGLALTQRCPLVVPTFPLFRRSKDEMSPNIRIRRTVLLESILCFSALAFGGEKGVRLEKTRQVS